MITVVTVINLPQNNIHTFTIEENRMLIYVNRYQLLLVDPMLPSVPIPAVVNHTNRVADWARAFCPDIPYFLEIGREPALL